MKANRSCQRADFGRRILDAKYATMPTAETKAREYAEVAVNIGGAVDMAVVCRECGGEGGMVEASARPLVWGSSLTRRSRARADTAR